MIQMAPDHMIRGYHYILGFNLVTNLGNHLWATWMEWATIQLAVWIRHHAFNHIQPSVAIYLSDGFIEMGNRG